MKFKYIFSYTHLVWFLILGIFLNVGYILYLALYPFKTVEIYNAPVPVLNSPVPAGGVVSYEINYCRFTDKTAKVTRTLVGKSVTTLADFTATSRKGCHDTKVANTILPTYTEPGTYHLEVNACFNVNPIRNECTNFSTKDFQVIAR